MLTFYSAAEFAFLIALTAILASFDIFNTCFTEALEQMNQTNIGDFLGHGVKGVITLVWFSDVTSWFNLV